MRNNIVQKIHIGTSHRCFSEEPGKISTLIKTINRIMNIILGLF